MDHTSDSDESGGTFRMPPTRPETSEMPAVDPAAFADPPAEAGVDQPLEAGPGAAQGAAVNPSSWPQTEAQIAAPAAPYEGTPVDVAPAWAPPVETGSPWAPPSGFEPGPSLTDERPEIHLGAAFVGGLALAFLLRRRGS